MTDLTEAQEAVLEQLPNDRETIADNLDISYRAVRYRFDAMEEKGYDFERDSEAVWRFRGVSDREGLDEGPDTRDDEPHRVNTKHKAQHSKDVNDALANIEEEVKEAIGNVSSEYESHDVDSDGSTLVIPRCDDHFGCKVLKRSVNAEFTTSIAKQRISEIIDRAIERSKERGDVDNVKLLLLGDHIDGENVFPSHAAEVEKFLREQIKVGSAHYISEVEKLADEFNHVDVVTCPGNHGNIGPVTNADDIVHDMVELGVDLLDIDNVSFTRSNGSYVNFNIRNFDGYGRHGQDALQHASTSSGDDRWMNWKEDSDFDVAYHGHHHSLRLEPVGHSQLFQCGTIVPPSLFVDSIGASGVPRAFFHFTTDNELVDEMKIIEFGVE